MKLIKFFVIEKLEERVDKSQKIEVITYDNRVNVIPKRGFKVKVMRLLILTENTLS
jgi:hypothetical protein